MSNLGSSIQRTIASLLVFILFFGLLPAHVFANEPNRLVDIKDHWAEGSIHKVVQEGLFKGNAEGEFDPQGSMTRAMFITVLYRLAEKLDSPHVAEKGQNFTDVSANAWYANAISWAVSAGLTDGYGDGSFGPNDLLNREQITVLMMRFLTSYMGYDLSNYQSSDLFADSNQISSWAKEAVNQAVALGLVQGETGNQFNPKGTASRAVVALITERFLEKSAGIKVDKPSDTPAPTATPAPAVTSTPTATPGPTTPPSGGNGGGGNGGSATIKVTDAKIQRNNSEVTGTVIRPGDKLTVAVKPSSATKTVKWIVNGKVKLEAETYTVGAHDVGAVITAEVTGIGTYSGTVTSPATGVVVASNIPKERLSLVDSDGNVVEDYSINAKGIVQVKLPESITYDVDLHYTLNIKAAENAAKYVIGDSAEAVVSAKVEDAFDVGGTMNVPIKITDADGKVITGRYSSFIKWFDEDGEVISLETVTVTVEMDERAATREQTYDVNRGVGTVEVMLVATNDENEDYYSNLNGYLFREYLFREGVRDNYNLTLDASFNKYIYGPFGPDLHIDYKNYSGLKLIFTPFSDESYNNVVAKASVIYWDGNSTRRIDLNTRLNDEGQLEVTTNGNQKLQEMAGTSNNLFLDVTVDVDDRVQQVYVSVLGIGDEVDEVDEDIKHIYTKKWTEVVEAFETYPKVYVSYQGEAVNLIDVLKLQPNQHLDIQSSNFTIGKGGELRLVGSKTGGAHVISNGEIIVSDGGKITTNSQFESQSTRYYSGVIANRGLTVASGGEITVPEFGLLLISGDVGLVIQQDGALNVMGDLTIQANAEINGALNIMGSNEEYSNYLKGNVYVYGDLIINKLLEVSGNGHILVSGMTTIQEDGELRLTKGSIDLNGKSNNYGKIAVQEGDLTLSNVGYAVNNDGIIELAASARLTIPGTTLVNNKTISGFGTITLKEYVDVFANYDNGIKYVTVDGVQSSSNYNRYQFVSDPDVTVTGIIYESKISGIGNIAESIIVDEIKIPE